MTRQDSPGSLISDASNCILMRFAPAILNTLMSCASISTQCRV